MNTVKSIVLQTPDGVDRELRFTSGAKKRIFDRFGMSLKDALNKYDDGAFPEILHALMYDAKGKPPAISIEELSESLAPEDSPEIMASILSAATQGRKTKNELEPIIRADMEARAKKERENLTLLNGSTIGALQLESLDLPTSSSGGNTSNAKSSPESSDGSNKNDEAISEPHESKPQSTT